MKARGIASLVCPADGGRVGHLQSGHRSHVAIGVRRRGTGNREDDGERSPCCTNRTVLFMLCYRRKRPPGA